MEGEHTAVAGLVEVDLAEEASAAEVVVVEAEVAPREAGSINHLGCVLHPEAVEVAIH